MRFTMYRVFGHYNGLNKQLAVLKTVHIENLMRLRRSCRVTADDSLAVWCCCIAT